MASTTPRAVRWDADQVAGLYDTRSGLWDWVVAVQQLPVTELLHVSAGSRRGEVLGRGVLAQYREWLTGPVAAEQHPGRYFAGGTLPAALLTSRHVVNQTQAADLKASASARVILAIRHGGLVASCQGELRCPTTSPQTPRPSFATGRRVGRRPRPPRPPSRRRCPSHRPPRMRAQGCRLGCRTGCRLGCRLGCPRRAPQSPPRPRPPSSPARTRQAKR